MSKNKDRFFTCNVCNHFSPCNIEIKECAKDIEPPENCPFGFDGLGMPAWEEQKPVVDEGKQAMESVLTKIASEFGTPVGDVFALAEAIHEFKEQKKWFSEVIIESQAHADECVFCRNIYIPFGDKPGIMHAGNCPVIDAQKYLKGLEIE